MRDFEELATIFELDISGNKVMAAFHRSGRGELFVLRYLLQQNQPVSPSELGEALGSSAPRISAVLRSLETKGAISRDIDTTDRRNVLVTLTPNGRAEIKRVLALIHQRLIRVFTKMGREKANQFIALSLEFYEIAQRDKEAMAPFELSFD